MNLAQARLGQRVLIESVEGEDAIGQRLLEMGVLEGEEACVLALAPLGDPIEIRIRDSRLSLRRSEASRVIIRALDLPLSP
jgi:Fe2+ transport system protein FeoA